MLIKSHFFNKESHCLYKPICTYNSKEDLHCKFYLFSSVVFWQDLFNVEGDFKSPIFVENEMRNLHNSWLGYSDFLLKYECFRKEEFHYFFC